MWSSYYQPLVCASGTGKEGTRWARPQCVLVAKPAAGLWDTSSLRSFAPRFRAKALGMLLGERGSACDLCDALIQLTTASLEQAGSSWGRREQPTRLDQPPGLHRDGHSSLVLLLRMGGAKGNPESLGEAVAGTGWCFWWSLLGGLGRECPGLGVGFVELRDRHSCRKVSGKRSLHSQSLKPATDELKAGMLPTVSCQMCQVSQCPFPPLFFSSHGPARPTIISSKQELQEVSLEWTLIS